MKKLLCIVMVLCMVFCFYACNKGTVAPQEPIDLSDIENTIADLQAENTALKARIEVLEDIDYSSDFNTVNSIIQDLQETVANYENQIATMQVEITSINQELSSELLSLQGTIANLQTALINIQTAIGELSNYDDSSIQEKLYDANLWIDYVRWQVEKLRIHFMLTFPDYPYELPN